MDMASPAALTEVSIIVPARNEEACLAACLSSLATQTGVAFEIIVVDDYSTDRTRQIAERFSEIRVISPLALPAGWTGKNNALLAGVQEARGQWFLLTDADTVHQPGSLARALAEAKQHAADMLSYSPEQIAVTFWEMAVLPVVFAELARQYPPTKVSDPASPIAAANGQYILIRRDAYEAVGGHRAIAGDLLEDVALARAVKAAGRKLRFRYAADAVRTRMYRNFQHLREGWKKNLALLFPNTGRLAAKMLLLWAGAWIAFFVTASGWRPRPWWAWAFILAPIYLGIRLRRANFAWDMEILGAVLGMPMFAYLLLLSTIAYSNGQVSWKGRDYRSGNRHSPEKAAKTEHIDTAKVVP